MFKRLPSVFLQPPPVNLPRGAGIRGSTGTLAPPAHRSDRRRRNGPPGSGPVSHRGTQNIHQGLRGRGCSGFCWLASSRYSVGEYLESFGIFMNLQQCIGLGTATFWFHLSSRVHVCWPFLFSAGKQVLPAFDAEAFRQHRPLTD